MAKRKRSSSAGEETVNHYGLVRMNVVGYGFLKMRLLSLKEVRQDVLVPFILNAVDDTEPTRLANFTQQRASLEIKTTAINETFTISKVVVFVKPVATSYPGS